MNILTFDIEEWYIYQKINQGSKSSYLPVINGYLDKLLDLLDAHNFKATFFCLGIIGKEYPEIIRRISGRGHEIGCHSFEHRWLGELSFKEMETDTRNAVSTLEDVTGKKIKSYRAPAFSIGEKNKWAFEVLAGNGIEYDSSVFPASRDYGGFPSFSANIPSTIMYNGISIKEIPIGTIKVFGKEIAYSGGGYFRLMPYYFVKKAIARNNYCMVYLHVRDFHQEQKRYYSKRFIKDYYGIKHAYAKFCQLLEDFNFANIEISDKLIDWKHHPVINLSDK